MSIQITSPTSGRTNATAKIEQATNGASPWYMIPQGASHILVDVIPAGNTCSIETTNNYPGAFAETAVGIPWIVGDVTADTQGVCAGAAAIRLVSDGTNANAVAYISCVM